MVTYRPDFKKAYVLANEILLESQQICEFPFSVSRVIREMSDVKCCSFERAREHQVDIEAFGSNTAILTEYAGKLIIFYNERHIDERIRFSMLHEIGHYLLNHVFQTNDKDLYEKQEIETNFFTAQLLMPEQLLLELQRRGKCLDADAVAELFKVSKPAAVKRLETIQKRNPNFRSRVEKENDNRILMKYEKFLDSVMTENKQNKGVCKMTNKQNQNYVFIPRCTETAEKVKEEYASYAIPASAPSIVFEAVRTSQATCGAKKKTERVKIYKDELYKKDVPAEGIRKGDRKQQGKIHFVGADRKGAEYRKFDLQHDAEHVLATDATSPTLKELQLDYSVVGSDEIGNGDVFKPIIVTAAYVNPATVDELIRLNVQDSKEIKNQIDTIGAALTGIEDFSELSEGTVRKTEYLTFCSKVLSNSEYDEVQKMTGNGTEKNKNDLLRELHAQTINALTKACNPEYVVVDDFMDGNGNKHAQFFAMLDMEQKKVFLREKADGLNLAVAAASVISSYLGNLYLKKLNEKLHQEYGMKGNLQPGADLAKKEFKEPLAELKAIMEKRGESLADFMEKYAKTSFENVANSEWMRK